MALWNVRSLTNKSFIINDLIQDMNLDCMFLTETWLGMDGQAVLNEAAPPNFSSAFSTRNGKRGASILASALGHKLLSSGHFIYFEYHAVLLKCKPNIVAVTVYRPPKHNVNFLDEFSELLSIIHANYSRIIVVGDFNLHADNTTDVGVLEFNNLLISMDFMQHLNEATHKQGHTLDLVITRGVSIAITSVSDFTVSDHFCVFFTVLIYNEVKHTEHTIKKRYLDSDAPKNCMTVFQNSSSSCLHLSCNDPVDCLCKRLRESIDHVAPISQKSYEQARSPLEK